MYWIKNHYLDTKLEMVGDWLIHPYMMIRKDKVTLSVKYKKNAETQSLSDNFSERLTEHIQAKDKFPVLKRTLTHDKEPLFIDDIEEGLIWEFTTLDNNTNEVIRWANPFLLGWLLYHLGIRKDEAALNRFIWMISLEKGALYLLENNEVCAMLMLIRRFGEDE